MLGSILQFIMSGNQKYEPPALQSTHPKPQLTYRIWCISVSSYKEDPDHVASTICG